MREYHVPEDLRDVVDREDYEIQNRWHFVDDDGEERRRRMREQKRRKRENKKAE